MLRSEALMTFRTSSSPPASGEKGSRLSRKLELVLHALEARKIVRRGASVVWRMRVSRLQAIGQRASFSCRNFTEDLPPHSWLNAKYLVSKCDGRKSFDC